MSKMLFPIPVDSPILQTPNQFSITWQKYLKAIGDDLLTANKIIQLTKEINYTVNGNLLFYNFQRSSSVGDILIKLPYPNSLSFKFDGVMYNKGSNQVTINAGTDYLQDFYFI